MKKKIIYISSAVIIITAFIIAIVLICGIFSKNDGSIGTSVSGKTEASSIEETTSAGDEHTKNPVPDTWDVESNEGDLDIITHPDVNSDNNSSVSKSGNNNYSNGSPNSQSSSNSNTNNTSGNITNNSPSSASSSHVSKNDDKVDLPFVPAN